VITFIVWKWFNPTYRTVFLPEYVNILRGMLRRHYHYKFRLICITDDAEGIKCETFPIWNDHAKMVNPCGAVLPSCYRRLKIFHPDTTQAMGIEDGDRVVSMDLDTVITDDLTPTFECDADFKAWKGVGSWQPVVYNGSLFMFRAGRMRWLWDEFDPVTSPQQTLQARYFGSDQAWMSFRLNGSAPGWDVEDGVYSYARDVHQNGLPNNARVVFFNGKRKPWEPQTQTSAPWITRHWRA